MALKMKKKFIFITIEERNGEQEYSHNLVREISKRSDSLKWVERNIVKSWYDDDVKVDGFWYYFFGGTLAARVKSVIDITKEEFDVLNKFI